MPENPPKSLDRYFSVLIAGLSIIFASYAIELFAACF
jgi:hypothetical protein